MTVSRYIGTAFPRFAAFAGFTLALGLTALAAQPPGGADPKGKPTKKIVVEDEDPKGPTVKKKVVVDDPEPGPAAGNPSVRLDELSNAAAAATNPAVKALLARYAVPFDRATFTKEGPTRVRPIPLFRGDRFPPKYGVVELDAAGKPKPSRAVTSGEVRRFDYFEELAVADVDQWLKQRPVGTAPGPANLSADDQLAAAELVLAAVLRFHDFARTNQYPESTVPIRSGKGWDDVRRPLDERLKEVRLRQLQRAVSGSDWQNARLLGTKLMSAYPKDVKVAEEVGTARVAEAQLLLKSKAHADLVKARELLDEFEARFAGLGGEQVRLLRKELTAEAVRMVERARAYKAAGNTSDARNELDQAEALDPGVPGLLELKKELGSGYATLYVGARQFPERMSPATARFDSERQAVELLFEGLLTEVPDGTGGVRYRPGAALGFPTVTPGGRDLVIRQVPPQVGGTPGFDAHDVVETVRLLRARPHLWASAGLPWIDDVHSPQGGGSLRFAFRYAHPDPRSLLTLKLQPGRWLAERSKAIDDPEFATRPFGTGPYRLYPAGSSSGGGPREVVFVANPAYSRGPAPIREIRFVEMAKIKDPFDAFRRGFIHILPDLTGEELDRAVSRGGAELGGKGEVVTASTNRRVHVLAVNHRRTALQNRNLRRGLSLAIDREGILTDIYRTAPANYRRFTAAMSGPFPPNSWANVKGPGGQPIPLYNPDQALGYFRSYLISPGAVPDLKLSLAYPATDKQAEAVCERIKSQVEGLFKDAADGKKVSIVPEPLDPRDLRVRVEVEHRYDLAYVPFDYPDDWHPFGLAAYLDPAAAGRDGRNVTGYLTPDAKPDEDDQALGAELASLRVHRDFAGQLAQRATRIHNSFNLTVPFVPLWQLDRHTLVPAGLKVYLDDGPDPSPVQLLDPTVLFHNVARWRLE